MRIADLILSFDSSRVVDTAAVLDTAMVPHAPNMDGLGTVLWIAAAIAVVVIGGLLVGLYHLTR